MYKIEPAYLYHNELVQIIMKAGNDPINKWFFTDGSFSPDSQLEYVPNTWQHENFVVIENNCILAYFESFWSKPLDIITSLRVIFFDKNNPAVMCALFDYFDYLFVIRGCKALNWFVAEKNFHAHRVYEKAIKRYFGHKVGIRHHGQMAYNGEISDVILYEVTQEEYFEWKSKKNLKKSFA